MTSRDACPTGGGDLAVAVLRHATIGNEMRCCPPAGIFRLSQDGMSPAGGGIRGVDWQNQKFRQAHNLNIYKHYLNHGARAMIGESSPG